MPDHPAEIAGYRIRAMLGTGAASTIYHAVDPADGKAYALKLVQKKSDYDQRYVDQALNEYKVSARVAHPNLRRTFKLIRHRQLLRTTEVLLLMELVEGENLGESRPRTLAGMIKMFRAVARGLAAMHAVNYVHADMKPKNILLSRSGGIKVIDFGQSCPIGTVKSHIQGTPKFIAPEQVKRKAITPATDVFNLGATMYWCVTEQHAPTKMYKPQDFKPSWTGEAPKMREPRELRPDLPLSLNGLIMDCLHSRPERRPKTMDEVRARLGLVLYQIDQLKERTGAPAPAPGIPGVSGGGPAGDSDAGSL